MRRMLNIFMLGVFTVASVALAKQNDCENFHIQISNLTGAPCILTSLKRIHGSLITPPPMTILPNDSKRFDMSQTLFGPAIQLSYQCGNENITFISRQHYCLVEAGNIRGSIVPPMPTHVMGIYIAMPGSYFWSRSGSISWKLEGISGQGSFDRLSSSAR